MGRVNSNKRGIFFTFISITVMIVFILVFTPQANISLDVDVESVNARISSLDNFVSDLEERYLEIVLRATTYKTLLSLIYYINSTGYLTDLDSAFSEVSLYGTINGEPIDSITNKAIMENSTLINWTNKIIETAKDTLGVNTTITITEVSVTQTSPWKIDASMNINYTVESTVADWEKNAVIKTEVSIEGFYDPYYLVNTNGLYDNKIKKTAVEFNKWNISHVREHIRNGTYVHWQDSNAPSFLMRFTNTISGSECCAIESLVDPNKVVPSDRIESYVDYIFWDPANNIPCSELYNITNPPTSIGLWDEFRYFKLDFNNLIRYNVTSQDAVKTC